VIKVNLKEAEEHLDALIEEATAGQEVVITGTGGSVVQLVPVPQATHTSSVPTPPAKTVGHALDRFMGTWTAEQEAELLQAVEIFERVDESFWQ
jgi:antitoxin (DNA-binding transcriptional repressor) of toxin-antitoxin stability system